MASLCLGHLITMRSRAWDDEPLIAHELRHTEQLISNFYIGFVAKWLFSGKFRLWTEVDAYRVQLSHYPSGPDHDAYLDHFARVLSERYHGRGIYRIFPIDVTCERAKALLMLSSGSPF